MHVNICNPNNVDTLQRFRRALQRLDARCEESHESALGVWVTHFRVSDQHLTVYQDAWSVDIEGEDMLIQRVIDEMRG